MGEAARKLKTFDELYREIAALPNGITGEILEPGVLRTMSRPGRPHRFGARRALKSLRAFDELEGGTGWWFEVEAEIRFASGKKFGARDLLVVPDVSGWRANGDDAFLDENPIRKIPDWCCEVLSPSTGRIDRLKKLAIFAKAGVQHMWLVDPESQAIEVYVPRDNLPALFQSAAENEVVELAPFKGQIEVGTYWQKSTTRARR